MLDVMVLREVLPHMWRHAYAPLLSMTARRIVRVFRETGFVTDDVATVAPTESITVFRGCHPKVRLGVSWTTERAVAQSFSEGRGTLLLQKAQHARMVTRPHMVGPARVLPRLYTASAPPKSILAIFRERDEHEVIVDPRRLLN